MTLPVHIDTNGVPRVLAVLPPLPGFGGQPKFSEVSEAIPRTQWQETDLSGFAAPILDQGQHGSCVGHGAVTSFWRAWLMAGGTHHDFSACYIYGEINRGSDQGAVISDAADCLLNKGVCLLSTVPEGMVFSRNFPSGADAEAARFKASLVVHCEDFDEIASAIQQGFCVAGCVRVGNSFNNLDSNGVPPASRGMGNHCIAHVGLKKLSDGTWGLLTQNSWGVGWGLKGYYVQTEAHYANQAGVDAFGIQAVAGDPQEVNLPPVVG